MNDLDGDGVCDELEVLGCTDNTAFNFDSSATDDDSSCIAILNGCIDSNALNYDSLAIQTMEVVITFLVVQIAQHLTITPMQTLMMVLVLHLFMVVLIQYLLITTL